MTPQIPSQGFAHFLLMQAWLLRQSSLLIHSGLQFGGDPINSGIQLQEGECPITWHSALGPHGDGSQRFIGVSGRNSYSEREYSHE